MDKLTVEGVGKRIDGAYDCDLSDLLINGGMLVSEAAAVKDFCGARGYEIASGFLDGDWTIRAAVAMVVLGRHDVLLDAKATANAKVGAFTFHLAEDLEEDAENPPGEGTPSKSGGEYGPPTSVENQENDPAPIGRLASAAS